MRAAEGGHSAVISSTIWPEICGHHSIVNRNSLYSCHRFNNPKSQLWFCRMVGFYWLILKCIWVRAEMLTPFKPVHSLILQVDLSVCSKRLGKGVIRVPGFKRTYLRSKGLKNDLPHKTHLYWLLFYVILHLSFLLIMFYSPFYHLCIVFDWHLSSLCRVCDTSRTMVAGIDSRINHVSSWLYAVQISTWHEVKQNKGWKQVQACSLSCAVSHTKPPPPSGISAQLFACIASCRVNPSTTPTSTSICSCGLM